MPITSRTRSQVVRQSLHLRINPSSYTSSELLIASRTPPSAAATMGSQYHNPYYSPPTGVADSNDVFSVLCKYDFTSEDDGILPFKKNEILDIIKCDNTGWWAAMRKDGPIVGWIPEAYVTPLTNEMAEKLRNIRDELRPFELEAEKLYDSAPVSRIPFLFDTDSATTSPLPEYEDFRTNTPSASYHTTREALQPITKRDQKNHSKSSDSQRGRPQPPPSPNSPMPCPPGPGLEKRLKHSASSSDVSRMKAPSLSRNTSLRPRPVMLEDNSALSRLSTLIESGNKKDIKKLVIPDISGSFEAISIRGRESRAPKRKGSGNARQIVQTVIDIKPSYLQLQFADQIDEDDRGHIRTATLPALIERLTTDLPFANLTELAEHSTFTNVFLMTFRTFTTAIQLFDILVDRYHMGPSKHLEPDEYQDWKQKLRIPTQRRILEVFSIWLKDHRLLEEEPYIAQKLTQFLSTISTSPHNTTAHQIIKTIERLTFAVPHQPLFAVTPKKARKPRPHRNDLLRLDPSDLAEQLALLEFTLYAKITPQECLSYAKNQSGETVAKLQDFCSTHDKLGSWVKSSILNHEVLGKRSDTVDFWIKVAEKCRLLNNFDAMSAIIIALSSTVITRLHLTWAHVSRRSTLESLLRHNGPNGGFAGYRALMQNVDGPCVPFIGMYLTDIVHTQEQFVNPDNDGKICFYQRARRYEITTNILKFQNRVYNIATTEQTMKFIEDHLKEGMGRDQNWFWSKSQEVQRTEVANADIRKGLEEAGF